MWDNFTRDELKCKCGCNRVAMNIYFMDQIQAMRTELGFPFHVTSAYRCPRHNNLVSNTGFNGVHVEGIAIDLSVNGNQAYQIMTVAKQYGITGIGLQQHKGKPRFIHLDAGVGSNRPIIFTY